MTKGLEILTFNHAGAMKLKNGITANYGVIRVAEGKLVYFTGKGLREIWAPNMTEEQKKDAAVLRKIYDNGKGEKELIASQHIAITDLDDIDEVLF
jgi:hypothetical protein